MNHGTLPDSAGITVAVSTKILTQGILLYIGILHGDGSV
jgi:hypothetical protein